MNVVYRLKRKDIAFLRSRLGRLLTKLGNFRKIRKPVYAIGDQSIFDLSRAGVRLESVFYDNMIGRKPACKVVKNAISSLRLRRIVVASPRGVITGSLWNAAKAAVKTRVKVFVRGEEDLAAVAVILLAQPGRLVAYGLPKKGIVLVTVTKALKGRIRRTLGIG